ncbi:MAG TPA: hypothetical protein VFC37_16190 [Terracidiphilus sp.]|nr:hypothetical protein [Terracidiphilus sp.]
MCLARRDLTPKARRILAIGNLCLAGGLTLSLFDKDIDVHYANLYDGLRGFFIGLAIALIFCASRLSGKCSASQP